eukprot:8806265-Pyramimonas_sp.AAC.1
MCNTGAGSLPDDTNHPSLKFMEGFQAGLELGTLEDLRECTSGGLDPDGQVSLLRASSKRDTDWHLEGVLGAGGLQGASVVPADVMWSDPMPTNGLRYA